MKQSNKMWITWENQRRSQELARALNCDFYVKEYNGFLRYPKCILDTLAILINEKYSIVFVQNPSMILAALTCICKKILDKIVIVDRHSTFRLNKGHCFSINNIAYNLLNRFTIKSADITIVTNIYLSDIVNQLGGRSFVLPDKIPDLISTKYIQLSESFNILFICSFHKDEPVGEVLRAVDMLVNINIKLYISGNYNKLENAIRVTAPSNVVFTGYLSEEDYVNLLFSVDAIIVLTTAENTMLCGCYEAVAACKPLITSNKKVLRDYFNGSIFVDNTRESIAFGIKKLINNYNKYLDNIIDLKGKLKKDWELKYNELVELISEKN